MIFSLYAPEPNSGKTGKIWLEGNVHRKARSRDTEHSVTDSYRDRKEFALEFGRIKDSLLMIRYRNTPFICYFVLLIYNLDIGRDSLGYRGPLAWELTPISLKQSHSLKNFKIVLNNVIIKTLLIILAF